MNDCVFFGWMLFDLDNWSMTSVLLSFLYRVVMARNTSNNWNIYNRMPKQLKQAKIRPLPKAPVIPEGTYIIEKIVNIRIEGGHRQYLIKWQGYDDPADNTWEPLSNLTCLTQDIIDYERAHTTHIKRIENKWKKMYQDQEVSEPLEELDLDKMQQQLDLAAEDISPVTPDSQELPEPTKIPPKVKPIIKEKDPAIKTRCKLNQFEEEAELFKKAEKQPLRKRGRKPYKSIAMPKHEPRQQCIKISEEKVWTENRQKEHLLQTPERGIMVGEDIRKTRSQDRAPQEYSCYKPPEEDPIVLNEEQSEEQQPESQAIAIQKAAEKEGEEQPSDHQIDKEIYSYLDKYFYLDNSVAEVLSRPIELPRSDEERPHSELPEVPEESQEAEVEDNKPLSYFRNITTQRTTSSSQSRNPLPGKKYTIHRKRKNVPEREPEPQNPLLKPTFQEAPIIEVEEEQKESTPVNAHLQLAHKEYLQEQQEPQMHQTRSVHYDEAASDHQPQQDNQPVLQTTHNHSEEPPFPKATSKQEAAQVEIVPNKEPTGIEVSQRDRSPSLKSIENDSARIQIAKRTLRSPSEESKDEGQLIDRVTTIIDRLDKKNNSLFIELTEGQQRRNPPQITLINLEEDSRSESSSRQQSLLKENLRSFDKSIKSKKIKKEVRECEGRGIVGRSEQALMVGECGQLSYRPSLNTLLQSLMGSSEVRLLNELQLLKIINSFRMENVILFSVQLLVSRESQLRFVTYQTIREFFPRELLVYLEDKGRIEL